MRLEIDGKEADLGNNIIAITRKVIDLKNLSLRNIDITNRLRLPKSNQNQEIFNSADRVETTGTGFDKLYSSKIIDQFFIFNGIGFLNESNSTYDFQLSESSKRLFSNLNERINLLPWDQYDFTFNQTSYNNLKIIDTNNVWVWPIIAMHEIKTEDKTRFTAGDAGLKWSRPVFSFKKILLDLIENQGWTIELDTTIIDRIGISSNAKKFFVTSYQKTLDEAFVLVGSENIDNLDSNDFENNVTTTSTTIDIVTVPTTFRLRGPVLAENDVNIKIVSTSNPSGKEQTKEFVISKNQTYIDFKTDEFDLAEDTDTENLIEIIIDGIGEFEFQDTLFYTIIEEQQLGNLTDNNLIGYRVKAFDNMPADKKQIDIFRDALKITNSIITPDSFEKKIELKTLNNLSKLKSIDWSNKFNTDSYTVINKISGYAQVNNLIYDNDDTVGSDLGFESFEIENESLKDSIDVLGLDWGASNEVEIENQNLTIASFNIYDDNERINEINNRLVYIDDDQEVVTFTLGRFLQLDWRSLKTNYYSNWFDSFGRLRIIKGEADLNKLDVIAHDFLNLVYIEKLKSSFFVLDMEDFVSGKATRVQLLKFL